MPAFFCSFFFFSSRLAYSLACGYNHITQHCGALWATARAREARRRARWQPLPALGSPPTHPTAQALQDTVTCVGQPLGIVAADSEDEAQAAAAAVVVQYEELPAILDIEAAIAGGAGCRASGPLSAGRATSGGLRFGCQSSVVPAAPLGTAALAL